jgi:hypothetical protein
MIGGSGERKTLKLVARYADACNLFAPNAEVVAHKLDVLARHCDAEGRDFASVEKTIIGGGDPLGDTGAFMASMDAYAKLGIELVELTPMVPDPAAWVTVLGEEIVPKLAEL